MQRVTEKQLENTIKYLNKLTDSPESSYTRVDGKLVANIGNYHLSAAYGGYTLHRMQNEGGGVTTPLHCGYVSKRELYSLIHAYINGILSKQK